MVPVLLQSNEALAVGVVVTIVLITAWSSIENVPSQEKRALIVRGEYRGLLEPGHTFVWPFVSTTHSIDMRPQTLDVPRQEAIMQDLLPVTARISVDVSVDDAETAFLAVDDYKHSVVDKAAHTLRMTLGAHELSVALHNRPAISREIRRELNPVAEE